MSQKGQLFNQTNLRPSYSPDLNPLENIWACLKRRVSEDMPNDIQSLKNSIHRHWHSFAGELI